MKMSLIRIIDAAGGEHYINQDAIVEFDPHVPNLESVVAIELNNGRRIFVRKSIAEKIIKERGEVVINLDLIKETMYTQDDTNG